MTNKFMFALTLAVGVSAATLGSTSRAQADDAMMMKMDCTQAGSMMTTAAKGSPPTTTGDIDKDFMAMMMDHEKSSAMLMKIEAACGTDPKTKAMATKGLADEDARMRMFRNSNTSQ